MKNSRPILLMQQNWNFQNVTFNLHTNVLVIIGCDNFYEYHSIYGIWNLEIVTTYYLHDNLFVLSNWNFSTIVGLSSSIIRKTITYCILGCIYFIQRIICYIIGWFIVNWRSFFSLNKHGREEQEKPIQKLFMVLKSKNLGANRPRFNSCDSF